jgi:hypothetical protein
MMIQAASQQHHGQHGQQRGRNQARAQQRQPARGQGLFAAHQVQVARRALGAADDGAAQRAGGHHGVAVQVFGVVAHHKSAAAATASGHGLLHRGQVDGKARGQLALAGAHEHAALHVQQVQAVVGVVQHQVAQEGGKFFGVTGVQLQQFVVLLQHTLQKSVTTLPGAFVFKTLEGQRHGDDHARGGGQAREQHRQRQAPAHRQHGQGASRIL